MVGAETGVLCGIQGGLGMGVRPGRLDHLERKLMRVGGGMRRFRKKAS